MESVTEGTPASKAKRGRKPKVMEPATNTQDNDQATSVLETSEEGSQANKKTVIKRGRKPKSVYNTYEAQPLEAAQEASDDENIILKLNVNANASAKNDLCSSVHGIPDAYNVAACDAFDSKPVEIESMMNDVVERQPSVASTFFNESHVPENQEHHKCANLKVVHLLKDFEEKNKNNEWPSNTSIACYWCCHRFDNAPFGIPVKYVGGKFHVYGCFCSLECAAAHNLASKESIDEMWERYNLINLLSRKLGYTKGYIKPAPNRLALRMFGGHIPIEDFRKYTDTNKLININFPPMMTMTQQIEEINESDISNEYKYIPIDTDRINKYKEKIKLKRTKPLHDYKNTLDHAMNLKFGA